MKIGGHSPFADLVSSTKSEVKSRFRRPDFGESSLFDYLEKNKYLKPLPKPGQPLTYDPTFNMVKKQLTNDGVKPRGSSDGSFFGVIYTNTDIQNALRALGMTPR